MDELVLGQPGFLGVESVRDARGLGVTVSYWADEESARAWRAQAEHAKPRSDADDFAWSIHVGLVDRCVTDWIMADWVGDGFGRGSLCWLAHKRLRIESGGVKFGRNRLANVIRDIMRGVSDCR